MFAELDGALGLAQNKIVKTRNILCLAFVRMVPDVNLEVITTLRELGGDKELDFVLKLIEQFRKDAAAQVELLAVAAGKDDTGAVNRAVHTLKSGCTAVGAFGMAALCEQLQVMDSNGPVAGAVEVVQRFEVKFARVREALDLETSKILGMSRAAGE